jgi:hypothetical protein
MGWGDAVVIPTALTRCSAGRRWWPRQLSLVIALAFTGYRAGDEWGSAGHGLGVESLLDDQ